jgi:Uma2 family endonuclease
MTPVTTEPEADGRLVETVADIVRRVDDVPLDRIIWHPFPATEDDVVRLCATEPKRLCELVNGVLVEKAMGYSEDVLGFWIGTLLNNFVVPRHLGLVGGPAAIMRLAPGMIRLPDVGFVPWVRLPFKDAHRKPIAPFAPDLAVEVLSKKNTRKEIARKRGEYFAAGTRLVWIVDPRKETVAVYTDPETYVLLTTADSLDGGVVLPGFTTPVAAIFGYLDRPDET